MANAQISRVLIPCLCIQLNNEQFISDNGTLGKILNVPCREVLLDEDLYWCSPVGDYGIFSQVQFRLALGTNITAPTFDSFYVQRVRDKLTNYTWWVYCLTADDFKNSSNSSSSQPSIPMPGTDGTFKPVFAPCQTLCSISSSNAAIGGVFGLPALTTGQGYNAVGSYNGTMYPSSTSSFSTVAALLTYLNSNWTGFTWTASADNITLFATGGNAGDSLCVNIYAK